MRILVTGIAGQLGYDVMCELNKRGHKGIGTDIVEKDKICGIDSCDYFKLDITDGDAVERLFDNIRPDAVIHCAAWTAVDMAEAAENKEKVYAVNVTGTENIAKTCAKYDAKMMYISTDYVFDGQGSVPWEADCKDYNPLNYYGTTKLQGELAVKDTLDKFFIVRVAWVFGVNGSNFVKTMLGLGRKYDTIRVVNDQTGTPTYTADLSGLLVDMIETEKYGYYHATNEGGYISWYDFACEIFKQAGLKTEVVPVSTEEYGVSVAKRPFNSRLDKRKLTDEGFNVLPDWKDALGRYLKELEK